VVITKPANNATLDRRVRFTATAKATDNVAVREVRMRFNGALCVTNAAPYECTFSMPGQRYSRSTLTAEATDTSGNVGTASIVLRTSR
jgi:hypothetical protein